MRKHDLMVEDACIIVTFGATLTGIELLSMKGFIIKMSKIDARVIENPNERSDSFFKLLFNDP